MIRHVSAPPCGSHAHDLPRRKPTPCRHPAGGGRHDPRGGEERRRCDAGGGRESGQGHQSGRCRRDRRACGPSLQAERKAAAEKERNDTLAAQGFFEGWKGEGQLGVGSVQRQHQRDQCRVGSHADETGPPCAAEAVGTGRLSAHQRRDGAPEIRGRLSAQPGAGSASFARRHARLGARQVRRLCPPLYRVTGSGLSGDRPKQHEAGPLGRARRFARRATSSLARMPARMALPGAARSTGAGPSATA